MRRVLIPHDISPLTPAVGAPLLSLQGQTMGTFWSVKLAAATTSESAMFRESLQVGIQAELDEVVRQMSTWEPDSVLTRYNESPAGTWHSVPNEFWHVLHYALQVAQWSDGAYDPSAGPLVNVWGFGPHPQRNARPSDEEIAAARARLGWQRVEVDTSAQRVLQPGGIYLDFSAIAKGFGVDQVARYLSRRGLQHHLVEVGGELRGTGIKPDAQPWWVELERPLTRKGALSDAMTQHIIALHGLSIATSGDYRKYFDEAGTRFCHTIDPRSGAPIAHGVAAVTVIHRDCITADAVSTALNVLGHEQGLALANQHEIAALFVVRQPDTQAPFTEHLSDAFKALLQ